MLEAYFYSALICYVLMYITTKKAEYNYKKINSNSLKPKFTMLKTILIIFTPFLNAMFAFVFLYYILLPTDKFIKEFNSILNK